MLLSGLCAALLCAVWRDAAQSQSRPAPPRRPLEQLRKMSIDAEVPGLADPFRGITANGRVEPGLFSIRSTGVSTGAVRTAASAFLAALSPALRAKTAKPVDDPEWRKWMNQSFYIRDGAGFLEMTPAQREAAFALMRASLSARGLTQTRDIMRLNETLAELNDNNFDELGEWQYFITVMGTPSATEPWGWQFDGHHAVINYFILGDQVVMSPFFAGSEPVSATSGKYKGTVVLQDEQNRGLAFVNSLSAGQRTKAILQSDKTRDLNLTEAWKDNVVLDYVGLPVKELTADQRAAFLNLVELYIGNMDDGHARVKMDEVRAHLDRTWFAWIGRTEPGSVFYYRIHSPVVLIEFDHQRPVGMRHLLNPDAASLQHIHTVVRTPNGNDYGKDLLRQHYAAHRHN